MTFLVKLTSKLKEMRNQRGNFIPLPTKSVKSSSKNVSRLVPKKSSCSQTERVVLIKEENLSFYPCTRIGQNDGGMRRDYTKAINYINSCHKFINTVVEKNTIDKNNIFVLPTITNYVPLFSYLVSKKTNQSKCKERKRSVDSVKSTEKKGKPKSEEKKSKSSGVFKKDDEPSEAPVHPHSVGDCEERNVPQQKSEGNTYALEVADIVKSQIQQFFSVLQKDIAKATKYPDNEQEKIKSKNVKFVKQRLQELSKICCSQKDLQPPVDAKQVHVQLEAIAVPPPPPVMLPPKYPQSLLLSPRLSPVQSPRHTSIQEDPNPSFIELEHDQVKRKQQDQSQTGIKITCYNSTSTIASESSDIKSDSDLEINY